MSSVHQEAASPLARRRDSAFRSGRGGVGERGMVLGTVAMQLTPYGQPLAATPVRLADGYWMARSGQRVSGVLAAHGVRPWTVTRLEPHLWLNPWAIQPYRVDRLWAGTDVDLRDGAINTHAADDQHR